MNYAQPNIYMKTNFKAKRQCQINCSRRVPFDNYSTAENHDITLGLEIHSHWVSHQFLHFFTILDTPLKVLICFSIIKFSYNVLIMLPDNFQGKRILRESILQQPLKDLLFLFTVDCKNKSCLLKLIKLNPPPILLE